MADACGFGWAIWDWKAGFHYWNSGSNSPASGLRDALFPRPKLRALGPGQFDFDSAVGKTFRVEWAAGWSAGWSGIATQTLLSPRFAFTDPGPLLPAAFYRVEWLKQE